MMLEFKIREEHELAHTLIMLCNMTRESDPIAYQQYRYQLEALKEFLMEEFETDEDL